jgi:hypothetical protein
MKLSTLALLFLCYAFLSCGNSNNDSNENNNANTSESSTLSVTVVSSEKAQLENGSRIEIALYGYDENVSDGTGILIARQSKNISVSSVLPHESQFDLNHDPKSIVCDVNSACQEKYYFIVKIDLDGDGQICDGDLIQDETMVPKESYTFEELRAQNHEVHMKARADGNCDAIGYNTIEGLYKLPVRLNSNEEVVLNQNSRFYIKLFGFDDSLEESPNVPIVAVVGGIDDQKLPFETQVTLLDEPAPSVCEDYDATNPCPDRYYYSVYIDIDGDNKICAGDLIQDYNITPINSYTLKDAAYKQYEVYLKVKTADDSYGCFSTSNPPPEPF